jgi:RNA polymerase sigma factor (sigma-70 family)
MGSAMTERSDKGGFPTTMRSQLALVKSADPAARSRSFEALALAYYKPVYKYTRVRWRKPEEEARDIAQDFFATAFEKNTFAAYDPAKARFRTYLRMCLDRFVSKRERAGRALKRGGTSISVPLDFDEVERELAGAPFGEPPEDYFDVEWTRHLLASAVDTLRAECTAKGKLIHFQVFERYDLHADDAARPSYADVASALGIPLTDVTNRLAYARREFRRLVLERLQEITATEDEFRSEAFAVLGIRL